MTRFAMLALLSLAGAFPQARAQTTADAFVLPGDYAQATTLADLQARFGAANVQVDHGAGEGGIYPLVVLFPDDPSRRAYVEFYEDAPLRGVHSIQVRDRDSQWRGKHGVRVGMSLAELRATNRKPFYFYGFDGQGRATVHDGWSPALDGDDGSLGTLDVDEGEHMYFEVELGLRAGTPASEVPAEDGSASSDDPRYPRLGEAVEVTAIGASTSLDDEWE